MAGKDELAQWWEGLDEQTRAQALAAQDSGQLTQEVASSLAEAGVAKSPKAGRPLPPDVNEFLKMRH